ncbi:MAG: accessory gene regulator B family protein [Lachnospiraceae bacterium]
MMLGCIGISTYVSCSWKFLLLIVLAMGNLILHSPIDHKNRRLDQEEKVLYKKITFYLTITFGVFVFLMNGLGHSNIAVCIGIGIIMTATLQLPCIIQSYKEK